jgi:hypothetical protein
VRYTIVVDTDLPEATDALRAALDALAEALYAQSVDQQGTAFIEARDEADRLVRRVHIARPEGPMTGPRRADGSPDDGQVWCAGTRRHETWAALEDGGRRCPGCDLVVLGGLPAPTEAHHS